MNRDCLPSVPRPRKRRPESENNIFQHPGTAILDAVPESKPAAVRHANPLPSPPLRTPASMQAASGGVPVNSLLSNNDLYHTSSRSFSALLGQGLRFDTLTIVRKSLLCLYYLPVLTSTHCSQPRNCYTASMRMPSEARALSSVNIQRVSLSSPSRCGSTQSPWLSRDHLQPWQCAW